MYTPPMGLRDLSTMKYTSRECESWSLKLREKHTLMKCEKRMARVKFGPMRED